MEQIDEQRHESKLSTDMSALCYAEIGSSNINYNSPLPLPLIFYHACITGGVLAARYRLN